MICLQVISTADSYVHRAHISIVEPSPGRVWTKDLPTLIKPCLSFVCPVYRSWLINPGAVTYWWLIPLAVLPAILGSILIVLDQQITVVIVNRKEHKLVVKTLFLIIISFAPQLWQTDGMLHWRQHYICFKFDTNITQKIFQSLSSSPTARVVALCLVRLFEEWNMFDWKLAQSTTIEVVLIVCRKVMVTIWIC